MPEVTRVSESDRLFAQPQQRVADFVFNEDVLIMTTLGSCIATCLWDRQAKIGGMNHFMLPDNGGGASDSGRYGSFAMELLINEMLKLGASRLTLEAKVFGGGAVISGMNTINVGERNTAFVMDYLKTERIPVVSKDVLEIYPRKVCFLPHSGKAMVKPLRRGLWSPVSLTVDAPMTPAEVTPDALKARVQGLLGAPA